MPSVKPRRESLRDRLIMSAALTGLMVAGYGRQAYAQCVGAGGTYTCTGTLTTTQSLPITPPSSLDVTTLDGFSIDTTSPPGSGGNAFTLTATGYLTFTDNTTGGASITGAVAGIHATNNGPGPLSITTNGTVTGATSHGIFADNLAGTDLTITAAAVGGGTNGIIAYNGSGALSITATGTVTGMGDDGISANNSPNGTSLTIAAAAVSGAGYGISASNNGDGALSITATGTVTGTNDSGISATNTSAGTSLTISAAGVSGGTNGIFASNSGSGALSITATGTVTGTGLVGIYASNSAGTNLTISAAGVSGGYFGIFADNDGSGALSITATGTVTATLLGTGAAPFPSGIHANNSATSTGGLTIAAAAVDGPLLGINARNYGSGALSITATGTVTGTAGAGIYARNGDDSQPAGTDLTISAAGVSGGVFGIGAQNYGTGALSITATGTVTATGPGAFVVGILAVNYADGTDLTISAAGVSGGAFGISAYNQGTGDLSITATGTVTAAGGGGFSAGIYARDRGADLTISAAGASGGGFGIAGANRGTGALSITATGHVEATDALGVGIFAQNGDDDDTEITDLTITVASTAIVEGDTAGVFARQYGSGDFVITNHGTVRNRSGARGDLAIMAFSTGAGVEIDNTSATTILGRLMLTDMDDSVDNTGLWENTGISDFGGGTDALNNPAGATVRVAGDGGANEFTDWLSLESFSSQGLLTMVDGNAGDALRTSGNFTGGGTIAIDVDFNTEIADSFAIGGDVLGDPTMVTVSPSGIPAAGSRIAIIGVGGETTDGDFTVASGIFDYALELEDTDGRFNYTWFLLSEVLGISAAPLVHLSVEGAGQALGRDLIGTLWERVGLRQGASGHGGLADVGNRDDFGAWLRVSGAHIDGDATASSGGISQAAGYDSDQWLLQGGVDGELYAAASGRLIGGLFAHWGRSDSSIDAFDGSPAGALDLDGYGGGASVTWYGVSGLYVDLLAQVTAYDADLSASGVGDLGSPDGWGIGTSLEVGFAAAVASNLRLVPQGQLVYQHIEFDDFTDNLGNTVAWDGSDSLEGRLGLAVETGGFNGAGTGFFAYADANLVYEFLDPAGVSVNGTQVTLDQSKTSVELGGGVNLVTGGEAVLYTIYLDGDYRIPVDGDGATILQGTAGFRTDW